VGRIDDRGEDLAFDAAYLVVKRFDVLYREFAANPRLTSPKFVGGIYALPFAGTGPNRTRARYRGLDRDPFDTYENACTLAGVRLLELEEARRAFEAAIPSRADADEILALCEAEAPGVHELAWARVAGSPSAPPADFASIGFEPSFFPSGCFSAIGDCLCFPRWHGCDLEGVAFREWFERLNPHGLLASAALADEYLRYYLSFDWTERGEFETVEVFAPSSGV
jgi:hypothetical protein